MEWIVVSGRTVDEARQRALDVLCIADEDAEVEVLASPGRSHWGLRHRPACIRMRVRQVGPPPRVGDDRKPRHRARRRSRR